MSNMAGLVVIAVGILVGIIGMRGTQKVTFGSLFGAVSQTNNNTNTTPSQTPAVNGRCPSGQVLNAEGMCITPSQ